MSEETKSLLAREPLERAPSSLTEDRRLEAKAEHEFKKTTEYVNTRKQLFGSLLFVFGWLGVGAAVYSLYYQWPYASALYYSAQAGLSIGFGALSEPDDVTRAYTVIHILVGSSVIGGAVGIFVTNTLEKHDVDWEEEKQARLQELEQQAEERGEEFTAAKLNVPVITDKKKKSSGNKTYRLYAVVVLWLIMGISYGMLHEGWSFVQSVYFCVTGWSTAGLQAPTVDTDGSKQATWVGIFLTIFVTAGVPIYGMVLGQYANITVDNYLNARQAEKVSKHLDASQIAFARTCATNENQIDFQAFLTVSLIRLGAADEDLIASIKDQFTAMDFDGDGYLEMNELIASMRFGTYDIGRNNLVEKSGFDLLFDDLAQHNTFSSKSTCVMCKHGAHNRVWEELSERQENSDVSTITLFKFQAFYNFVSDLEKYEAWDEAYGTQWLQPNSGLKMPLVFKQTQDKLRLDRDKKLMKQKSAKLLHFLKWTQAEQNKKWLDSNINELKQGGINLPDEAFHMKHVSEKIKQKTRPTLTMGSRN